MNDYVRQLAAQRYNELEAVKVQRQADFAAACATGDDEAAKDAIEQIAATEQRLAQIADMDSRYTASQQPQQYYDPRIQQIQEAAKITGLTPEEYCRGADYMYASGRYSSQQGNK